MEPNSKNTKPNLSAVRERLEKREELLSPFASRSVDSVRAIAEEPSDTRTEFQRDRDRVIHTN